MANANQDIRDTLYCLMTNVDQQKRDINEVRDYVKEDLFFCIIFLWDERTQLAKESTLHKDFVNKCLSKVANGQLVNAEKTCKRPTWKSYGRS